jgi:hypothetical protein
MTTSGTTAPVFDFCVDANALPGDLIPAMAKLLISMARRRRELTRGEDDDDDRSADDGAQRNAASCGIRICASTTAGASRAREGIGDASC